MDIHPQAGHPARDSFTSARTYPHTHQPGYTLIEILITIAIAGILGITALPSLNDMLQRNRIAGEVNQIIGHLHLARSEAVKTSQRVVMCTSIDGMNCVRTNAWELGWIVFVDENSDREHNEDEPILRKGHGLSNTVHISTGASPTSRRKLVYQPTGFAGGSTATFTFCARHKPELARAVIVSNTGRPRLSDRRANGDEIDCFTG